MKDETEATGTAQQPAAKAICDLDALVQAVIETLPPIKPWQRQLLQQLANIDRRTQVLRMIIAMNRPAGELEEAKGQLRLALRVAHRHVSASRAELGTKMAIGLACDLGARIDEMLVSREA